MSITAASMYSFYRFPVEMFKSHSAV